MINNYYGRPNMERKTVTSQEHYRITIDKNVQINITMIGFILDTGYENILYHNLYTTLENPHDTVFNIDPFRLLLSLNEHSFIDKAFSTDKDKYVNIFNKSGLLQNNNELKFISLKELFGNEIDSIKQEFNTIKIVLHNNKNLFGDIVLYESQVFSLEDIKNNVVGQLSSSHLIEDELFSDSNPNDDDYLNIIKLMRDGHSLNGVSLPNTLQQLINTFESPLFNNKGN